jgi:hypothetical protein
MARYKPYDLNPAKMIPLSYADQIVEGSFEHALNEIVEEGGTGRCGDLGRGFSTSSLDRLPGTSLRTAP